MTRFMARSARHFLTIRVVREIKQEIEKAGLDDLKAVADAGISVIGTYLNGCSPQEKALYRRDLNTLLGFGVTLEMLFNEVARQMPELNPIIASRQDYKKSEIQNIELFLREGQEAKK